MRGLWKRQEWLLFPWQGLEKQAQPLMGNEAGNGCGTREAQGTQNVGIEGE